MLPIFRDPARCRVFVAMCGMAALPGGSVQSRRLGQKRVGNNTSMQTMGVMPTFSRPAVSNDNPYSESLFKTLKYRPDYPARAFENLFAARQWVGTFVHWYNHEHRHSAVRFVTPEQRHAGQDVELLAKRVQVYEAAKVKNPQRWSGSTRNWEPVRAVHLNPDQQTKPKKEENQILKKVA